MTWRLALRTYVIVLGLLLAWIFWPYDWPPIQNTPAYFEHGR